MTPEERAAMRALHATGHYDETPDAFEWLTEEAKDVARIMATEADPQAAVLALLEDTAFHDVESPDEVACLRGDVDLIVGMLR